MCFNDKIFLKFHVKAGTNYPSLCRYIAEGTNLWKGVNKKMPVHLKRKNGEVTSYKNSEFIPAYYFIPKEAMTKLPRELRELPRNPWFIFRDWLICRCCG